MYLSIYLYTWVREPGSHLTSVTRAAFSADKNPQKVSVPGARTEPNGNAPANAIRERAGMDRCECDAREHGIPAQRAH